MRVRLRMTMPEGRNGTIVDISDTRARQLIRANLATVVDEITPELESAKEEVAVPSTVLPEDTALKAEWVAMADQLGINTYREDGSNKTKNELIDEVKAAIA